MNPTNIMVSEQGVASGLVDWEMMRIWPSGCDLGVIHWIKGSGFGEKYFSYENAEEIENRFWFHVIRPLLRHGQPCRPPICYESWHSFKSG